MANPEVDTSNDPTSVYYLHPSDSQYKLVPEKFNGIGYNDWKRSVINSLSTKNKLGFIDGTIAKPTTTSPIFKDWDGVNNTIISWFIQVLETHIARSIMYFDSARVVWCNLEERFGQTSGTQVFSLHQQIAELQRQGAYINLIFYTKLKMLWDELDASNPLPTYTCSNCTCNVL